MSREPGCKIPIGLVSALGEAGISAEHVLASAGLPSRLLDTPGRYVRPTTSGMVFFVIEQLAEY